MSGPLRMSLQSRTVLAPATIDYRFAMQEPAALAFQAGQFVSVAVGHNEQGIEIRRSYSLASSPRRGEALRLILRLVPGGAASTWFEALRPGQGVAMTGPYGFFVLEADHPGDVVFAVTGTGIAPVLPMLEELALRPPPGRVHVLWGNRHEADIFARAEVEEACRAASATLAMFLSAPPPGWSGGRGRIVGPTLEHLPALHAPTFYLVGNGAMIAELRRALVDRGIERKKRIRSESFFDG